MDSLYFFACLTGIAGVVLVLRHTIPWKADFLSAAVWAAAGLLAAALTWYITGSFDDLLLPVAVSLVFAVLVRAFIPHITSFGAGLLASRFCLPVCAMLIVHAGVRDSDWPTPVWIGYYAAQSLALALAVIGTLLGGLSFLPEFCFRYPKRDRALKTLADGRDKLEPENLHPRAVLCRAAGPGDQNAGCDLPNALSQF